MFTLLLPLIIALPIDNGPLNETRQGMWHGAGVQVDGVDWPISVNIMEDRALVDFPTLNCGGHWEYLTIDNYQITAVERITYGQEICVDGGMILISVVDPGSLDYRWLDKSGEPYAAAWLFEGELDMNDYPELLNMTMQTVGSYFIQDPATKTDKK